MPEADAVVREFGILVAACFTVDATNGEAYYL